MLGSHNSISYLPIKNKGLRKYTKIWSDCQKLTLLEQYSLGVRYFDIRLRLIDNQWHLCHNRIDYGYLYDCTDLFKLFKKKDVYYRFIFDERYKVDNTKEYTKKFTDFITKLKDENHLNIDCAICYWDWDIKKYSNTITEVIEHHAGVSAPWYLYLLGTKFYAKHYNRKFLQSHIDDLSSNNKVLLIDFIEYN